MPVPRMRGELATNIGIVLYALLRNYNQPRCVKTFVMARFIFNNF